VWTELVAGETAEVEVFVQTGGKLNARLEIRGPYALDPETGAPHAWDDNAATVHDGLVGPRTLDGAGDADAFASPTAVKVKAAQGGAYRACVENSVSRYEDKLVLVEWRSVAGGAADEDQLPIALTTGGDAKEADPGVTELAKRVVALRRELAALRARQARERRRLAHHKALNDATHAKVVEGSLIETAVYVVISAFQIIFVRRWFEGKGVSAVFGSDNV